jgi:hypothetical protein
MITLACLYHIKKTMNPMNEKKIWDHTIRNNDEYERIKKYIQKYSKKWNDDKFYKK